MKSKCVSEPKTLEQIKSNRLDTVTDTVTHRNTHKLRKLQRFVGIPRMVSHGGIDRRRKREWQSERESERECLSAS